MKLCVLDKDGTLIRPASGAKFPQTPTDQELLPGVKEAIDRMRADGWTFAIASNQGGCDWHSVKAETLAVGSVFKEDEPAKANTVIDIWEEGSWLEVRGSVEDFTLDPKEDVLTRYKTIGEAIEEMQLAADLCGIDNVIFCPSLSGSSAIEMLKVKRGWFVDGVAPKIAERVGNFRKPNPGLLLFSKITKENQNKRFADLLMIGDRPEDKAAADAAGFRFLDASEWRSGADVEEVRS